MRSITLTLTVLLLLCHVPMAEAQVYDDNVVIVLDASGSMKGPLRSAGDGGQVDRLTAAKTAIKEVVRTIPSSTNIGLLVFGGGRDGWVYPLGPRDDARLMKAVDAIKAGGGTPLGEYMKKGADRLLETRHRQYGYGTYRLLIVTD
ncbi:MAG: VWA domain-containing protein, partial [Victivallales bacterium]|nr:VWA domain-containing protein [Victivallales bacterium]